MNGSVTKGRYECNNIASVAGSKRECSARTIPAEGLEPISLVDRKVIESVI